MNNFKDGILKDMRLKSYTTGKIEVTYLDKCALIWHPRWGEIWRTDDASLRSFARTMLQDHLESKDTSEDQ